MEGKLNHLGMDQVLAKNMTCDGLRNISHEFFEDMHFTLVRNYQSFLSDSRTFGVIFKEVLLIDPTTICLFSDILKGVGSSPKGVGKKKGGLTVHMLLDAVQSLSRFIEIMAAKVNDKKYLKFLKLICHRIIVFNKAYDYFHEFVQCTSNEVYFVTQMKKNVVYEVKVIQQVHYRKTGQAKVLRDEIISLQYQTEIAEGKKNTRTTLTLELRKVNYQNERNCYFYFVPNNFDKVTEEVAFLYKKRCDIEILFFRKMKQNSRLHYFCRESEYAFYTQVWSTLIAQLLVMVTQKIAKANKAFSVVTSLTRIQLIRMLGVSKLLRSTMRLVESRSIPPGL
jgi:hypothetical protein